MKNCLSKKIVNSLVENKIVNFEDKQLYEYGLHQGVVMILNIITTIGIGIIFGMIWQIILFMIVYIPLRIYSGGYHSKTQTRCYIFSIGLTIVALLLMKMIYWTNFLCISTTVISAMIILVLAPVEDSNKPLDTIELKVYKERTIMILIFDVYVLFIFILLGLFEISVCISVGLLVLSIMLLLGDIKNIINDFR